MKRSTADIRPPHRLPDPPPLPVKSFALGRVAQYLAILLILFFAFSPLFKVRAEEIPGVSQPAPVPTDSTAPTQPAPNDTPITAQDTPTAETNTPQQTAEETSNTSAPSDTTASDSSSQTTADATGAAIQKSSTSSSETNQGSSSAPQTQGGIQQTGNNSPSIADSSSTKPLGPDATTSTTTSSESVPIVTIDGAPISTTPPGKGGAANQSDTQESNSDVLPPLGDATIPALVDETSTASSTETILNTTELTQEILGSPLAQAIRDSLSRDMQEKNDAQMQAYQQEIQSLYEELRAQKSDTWTVSPKAAAGCLLMPDGGHYCAPKPVNGNLNRAPASGTAIYAKNSNGQSEIFLGMNGKEMKLSAGGNNLFPALDPITRAAVWQSEINGVWQIMRYDPATGTSTLIASSTGPQTNPRIYGGRVVWQEWIDNNWEIMMDEPVAGIATSHVVKRISENPAHDMFPSIASGIISWERLTPEGFRTIAYDLTTDKEAQLEGPDGKHSNAKVGILFERTQNGLTDYWFYDIASGTVSRVGDPATAPDIPTPAFVTITRAVPAPKIETVATSSAPTTSE